MRVRIPAVLAVLILACCAGGAAAANPPLMLDRMGERLSMADARRSIAFQPFVPARRIIAVAVLPPFHGDDGHATRGIGFEYADLENRRYVLAQWPRNGGTIAMFQDFPGDPPDDCPQARTFVRGTTPYGIVWTTPHGLVLTLQADGANDARTLEIEWRKLIRRGACR